MRFFALLLLSLLPLPASAHVLETSGTVGAVIHLDPDDSPVAGQPTHVYFDLKDRSGAFDPAGCGCSVRIAKEGQTVREAKAAFSGTADQANGAAEITFPTQGAYDLHLQGPGFDLAYAIRVEQGTGAEPATTQKSVLQEHGLHIILIGGGILGFLVYLIINRKNLADPPAIPL